MLEPDFATNFSEANKRALRKEIRKAKKMTRGIIGVNVMVALYGFIIFLSDTFEGDLKRGGRPLNGFVADFRITGVSG
jgi:hypothetical protein